MYLLDTVTVSALRRPEKAPAALRRWVASVNPLQCYISVMTIFEVELGVRLLDRRDRLQAAPLRQWIDSVLRPSFRSRLLPVDEPVAIACAGLHVPDSRAARGALIAATAIVHGLTVATRNIRDFQGLPVALVDPWRAA